MQLWSDAMENMCSANLILAEAFTNHFEKGIRKKENDNKDNDIKDNDNDVTIELLQLRNTANTLQNMCKTYNDNIKTNVKKIFYEKCLFPTTEILNIVPTIEHKLTERYTLLIYIYYHQQFYHYQHRQGLKLDFDNYTAKLKTEEIREDEEKHKRNQIKLQKATAELDNMTTSILECMDEFDGSKPNLLATEFASAFACIYHFTSTSSCLIARLLPNIPMAASTLCSLYDADNILKNDSKYFKPSENKSSQEKPSHTYDLMSIFNRKTPPPHDDGNSSNSAANNSTSIGDCFPPEKPPKKMPSLNKLTIDPVETTETAEQPADSTPMRRLTVTKQKATFRLNSVDEYNDSDDVRNTNE